MANVFGLPIDDLTLQGLPEYADKEVTKVDRAITALKLKNAEGKDANCRKFVENMKNDWGEGNATLVMLYNATGDNVKFVCDKNWHGHNGPSPYPMTIQNGQWGGFLHVKQTGIAEGSTAAVVYRGKDNAGDQRDWFIGWNNPWDRLSYDNAVYCLVRGAGAFENNWTQFESRLMDTLGMVYTTKLYFADSDHGCIVEASTGSDSSPIVEAVLSLDVGW